MGKFGLAGLVEVVGAFQRVPEMALLALDAVGGWPSSFIAGTTVQEDKHLVAYD